MRQAMPCAFAQPLGDRICASIGVAIGVHDGFLLGDALDRRVAAHFAHGDGAKLDEADPELGQRFVRDALGIESSAQADGARNRHPSDFILQHGRLLEMPHRFDNEGTARHAA
ncbi:hypothetical protein [Paenibacillus anseongense]|uniref:hypothetical protein n=1 Tax=Paenibacillus anseongense TaxID=2682845 RepID=UPI002DB7F4AA|nr:hypothetical protein [Paenibacillus anseongense]MEC0268790.1 hypothetical protein [Paenibacillus anseongense]